MRALDVQREGLRTFRMDRIIDARLEEDVAPSPPADLDERLQRAGPYSATDEVNVRVGDSPKVARWIAERTAARLEHDGSAIVEHRGRRSRLDRAARAPVWRNGLVSIGETV